MSTQAKCGMTGETSLGGEIVNWEFNKEQDAPDATSMASNGFREHIPCLQFGSGSFETLKVCGAIGAHAGVSFTNDIETINCDIIITSVDDTVAVGDVIKYKYSYITTGPIS